MQDFDLLDEMKGDEAELLFEKKLKQVFFRNVTFLGMLQDKVKKQRLF